MGCLWERIRYLISSIMKSLILFFEEVSVGKYMGTFLKIQIMEGVSPEERQNKKHAKRIHYSIYPIIQSIQIYQVICVIN